MWTMASGKVKWWDNKKGFGFIAQDTGQDVFVHHTAIMGQGFKTLNEGALVSFANGKGAKGSKPQNVQRPHSCPRQGPSGIRAGLPRVLPRGGLPVIMSEDARM